MPVIDGYIVHEQIGSGGFSKVFRATQDVFDRPVAIKVLNNTFEDERQQRTFERECQVMGRLSTHPHIVTVYHSGFTASRQPCIVMELYSSTYRQRGVLSVEEAVDVGAKVADALQAVHDAGIVHRDIKPHNVFVSERGEPAIGDFGISSIVDERTITGGTGFSIHYAAPEVFDESGTGIAGDIYALGATIYHLLTGTVPFPSDSGGGDNLSGTLAKILNQPPPALERADAPRELSQLLQRCMAKTPEGRPSSAAALATELRAIHRRLEPLPSPAPEPPAGAPGVTSAPVIGGATVAGATSVVDGPSVAERAPVADRAALLDQGTVSRIDVPAPPSRSAGAVGAAPASPPVDTGGVDRRDHTVTVARPRVRDEDAGGVGADDEAAARAAAAGRRKRLFIGVGSLGVFVLIAVGLLLAAGGGDDTIEAVPTPTPGLQGEITPRPEPPTDVEVTPQGDRDFLIEWTAPEGDVDGYLVKVTEEDSGVPAQRVTDTSLRVSDLDADLEPCFEISSFRSGQGSTAVTECARASE